MQYSTAPNLNENKLIRDDPIEMQYSRTSNLKQNTLPYWASSTANARPIQATQKKENNTPIWINTVSQKLQSAGGPVYIYI